LRFSVSGTRQRPGPVSPNRLKQNGLQDEFPAAGK